jgi:hypothetical protein
MRRLLPLLLPLLLAVTATPLCAWGADPDLHPLAAALAPLRATPGANRDRDAGPELTPVKRLLREWIEPQLPPAFVPGPGGGYYNELSPEDLTRLGHRLSDALKAADLTCRPPGAPTWRCGGYPEKGDVDERGYVGEVRLRFIADRYLAVTTEVGVHCGNDQSLYLYEYMPQRRWRLVFQSEQDDYREGHYAPQIFTTVEVAPAHVAWNDPAPPPLVLTLDFSPWCQSNWRTIHTRLWRASPATVAPRPLLDRRDELYMGGDYVAAGRVTANDALIQFNGESLDEGTLVGTHVLHYAIGSGDRLTRIAPFALTPAGFVDEWLQTPWVEARQWLDPRAPLAGAQSVHRAVAGKLVETDEDGIGLRCRRDPDLWQVGWADQHFLVRWRPPYRFSLVDVRPKPFPACDRKVDMPDNIATLFPLQGSAP